MPTDQVRIRSLYAGLNLTVIWFGLSVAAAWLFARYSYYRQQCGHRLVYPVRLGHVFGRSGGHLQARPFLSARPGDGAQRRPRIGAERNRASPQPAQILRGLSYLGYLTGIVGTAVWGYGDLALQVVST